MANISACCFGSSQPKSDPQQSREVDKEVQQLSERTAVAFDSVVNAEDLTERKEPEQPRSDSLGSNVYSGNKTVGGYAYSRTRNGHVIFVKTSTGGVKLLQLSKAIEEGLVTEQDVKRAGLAAQRCTIM